MVLQCVDPIQVVLTGLLSGKQQIGAIQLEETDTVHLGATVIARLGEHIINPSGMVETVNNMEQNGEQYSMILTMVSSLLCCLPIVTLFASCNVGNVIL
jgi:hypothetical protein